MRKLAALVLMAGSCGAAAAEKAPLPETLFVGAFGKFCIDTKADPAAIAHAAEAFPLAKVDPAAVPGEAPTYLTGGKAFAPNHAWRLERAGATYWVSTIDVPSDPTVRDCFVSAWNLDAKAVDAVFTGGRSGPLPDAATAPIKQYSADDYTILYTLSRSEAGVLHVASFVPKPQPKQSQTIPLVRAGDN